MALQPWAGGTALAAQLGHRISQDLDLFANAETFGDSFGGSIVEVLREGHSIDRLQDSVMGLVLNVDAQSVSFFSYCYPLLAPIEKAVWDFEAEGGEQYFPCSASFSAGRARWICYPARTGSGVDGFAERRAGRLVAAQAHQNCFGSSV